VVTRRPDLLHQAASVFLDPLFLMLGGEVLFQIVANAVDYVSDSV
jgi:hypothetical protein